MTDKSKAILKASGVLDAAYFIHGRADIERGRSNRKVADALDNAADSLKELAVKTRG